MTDLVVTVPRNLWSEWIQMTELEEALSTAASVADASDLPPYGDGRLLRPWSVLVISITAAMLDLSVRQTTARLTRLDLRGAFVPAPAAVQRTLAREAWAPILAATFYESMSMVQAEAMAMGHLGIFCPPDLDADQLADHLRPSVVQLVSKIRAKTPRGERAEIILIATGRNLKVWDAAMNNWAWDLPPIAPCG